jgi:hypothetical protein
VIGGNTSELESPWEEEPAVELLADTPGLEMTCEEVPAFELLAGPLVVEDAEGTATLESDKGGLMTMLEPDERLTTMLVGLVTALLVVST